MIKIENIDTYGWEAAIRGMRNPMNSWDKSDSFQCDGIDCRFDNCPCFDVNLEGCLEEGRFVIGNNDLNLMKSLIKAGTDHRKFLRMINVTMDIAAPLYWWKEFDTYKVGTVRNSCSTMHKITEKKFTLDDFSHEHLSDMSLKILNDVIKTLNYYRDFANLPNAKFQWWQMIQLLPSSYNQRATVQLNYEVLRNMYHARKDHRLDEWREFCKELQKLPYSDLIISI